MPSVIATAVKHMLAAGMRHAAIVSAVEDVEAESFGLLARAYQPISIREARASVARSPMRDGNLPPTIPDLIDAFGGATAFGVIINRKPSTASEMKRRQSIPVDYWPQVVSAAAEIGVDLDYEYLVRLHVEQQPDVEISGDDDICVGENLRQFASQSKTSAC